MSIGMKLGMLGASGGGGAAARLVGLGNESAGNSDEFYFGSYSHNSNIRYYTRSGAGSSTRNLSAFMCTFYLDALDQDFYLSKPYGGYGTTMTIKADGSIYVYLMAYQGDTSWTTDAGIIETGKNYMFVYNCGLSFPTNEADFINNVTLYLCQGGDTVTHLFAGQDSVGDGIALHGSGYSGAGYGNTSSNERGHNAIGLVGSISAMHWWNGGILTADGVTALYNSGTPLTDPSSDSGNYSSTMAGYYYDGGDWTHLTVGDDYSSGYRMNDFTSPGNLRYMAGSGGPEVTPQLLGDNWTVLGP
jgi:hypothetical protein